MSSYYLKPDSADKVNSFYNKAQVTVGPSGKTLKSYDTDVLKITSQGSLLKLSDAYSQTTMRHINSFLRQEGYSVLKKKEWLEIDLVRGEDLNKEDMHFER